MTKHTLIAYIKYPDLFLLVGKLGQLDIICEAPVNVYDSLVLGDAIEVVEAVESRVRAVDVDDCAVAVADGVFSPRDDLRVRPGQREHQLPQTLRHIELE